MGELVPQSMAVKRAQVEFHNFASLGEPERAVAAYEAQNLRRGGIIWKHRRFIGEMSPFLEIGSNAGHTSYYLENELHADGFALDLSADSLRHGIALQERWSYPRAPIRVAGDALRLPFRDESIRFVMAFQMLSQFMDIESVIVEVKRVLAPGGLFCFAEEPLLRKLSLRLYRCPYYENMKPWERKLHDWGLLGYVARDVIGAHQEESFGIRQNHTFDLKAWDRLIRKHFTDHRYELFVPRRGWGESIVANTARRLDRLNSDWAGARLLGGTMAAICKKSGQDCIPPYDPGHFEKVLRCPDCGGSQMRRDPSDTIACAQCSYRAANDGGVYNLLPSQLRSELYPGDRADICDFSLPSHAGRLRDGWFELEGVFGNKYRWMGAKASLVLHRVKSGSHKLRVRGMAVENFVNQSGSPAMIVLSVNHITLGTYPIERTGVFVLEADLPDTQQYYVEIAATRVFEVESDDRSMSVNISMVRLVPVE